MIPACVLALWGCTVTSVGLRRILVGLRRISRSVYMLGFPLKILAPPDLYSRAQQEYTSLAVHNIPLIVPDPKPIKLSHHTPNPDRK